MSVCIKDTLKQGVRLSYTYNLHSEEREVGPHSRQVPRAPIIEFTKDGHRRRLLQAGVARGTKLRAGDSV